MKKKIWINLDETKVDITYLDQKFAQQDYEFIKCPIAPDDEERTIELGSQCDAVISTWEPWNERTLHAVR